jgi:hypothetical protein
MVGADEALHCAVLCLADDGAAMPANIEEGADLAITSPDYDERIPVDLIEEVLAGLGDLAGMAGKQPAAPPYEIHLRAVHQGIMIEITRQAVTRPLLFQGLLEVQQLGSGQRLHREKILSSTISE